MIPPREFFENGAFWCIFGSNFDFKKLTFFIENLLQLKLFGLYFEGILGRKWLFSYRNNDISYRDARRFRGMLIEKILKWLMRFDQIKS